MTSAARAGRAGVSDESRVAQERALHGVELCASDHEVVVTPALQARHFPFLITRARRESLLRRVADPVAQTDDVCDVARSGVGCKTVIGAPAVAAVATAAGSVFVVCVMTRVVLEVMTAVRARVRTLAPVHGRLRWAGPGRPRRDPEIAELEREVERTSTALKELAIENTLLRGKVNGG